MTYFEKNGDLNKFPKEMYKTTCADCKKDCQVPFKPKDGRPVYCRECYFKHKRF